MIQSRKLIALKKGTLMRLVRSIYLAIAMTGLVGCAAPSLQSKLPTPSQNKNYGLAKSETAITTNHMTQQLNADKSVVYFQNQGGGGVGLGLLLGPLGAVANMKMIESVTSSDVAKIKDKINLDPEAAFQQAATTTNFSINASANQDDVKVSPYVLVSKTDDSTIHISSIVLFEGKDGNEKWTRRYQYQLPGKYNLNELSKFDATKTSEIQTSSTNAYEALLKHIKTETNTEIAKEQKITFKSSYMSPRFDFEMFGSLIGEKEGRVWVRTITGVAAVNKEDIQYKVQN